MKIVKIDVKKTVYLPSGLSDFFPNINEYYVMSSELKFIVRSDFRGLENLNSLSFYLNSIESIPDDTFFDLIHLTLLSFSNNKLKDIPLLAFHNLRKLEDLYLQYNQIEYISKETFKTNNQLKYLILIGNNLKALSADLVYSLPNLVLLELENCSCISRNFDFKIDTLDFAYDRLSTLCQDTCILDLKLKQKCFEIRKSCRESVESGRNESQKISRLKAP